MQNNIYIRNHWKELSFFIFDHMPREIKAQHKTIIAIFYQNTE